MNNKQRVSLADVARHVNVSSATVSYVLNGRESQMISEATREKVLAAVRELGYRPNRAAQALAGYRSNLIELCVYGFYPAFYGHILHEFEQQFVASSYQLHIVNVSQWTAEDWENADSGWPISGIIAFDADLTDKAVESLKYRGVPVVATGVYPRTDIDHVSVETIPALLEAMRYLAVRGRRVAYLTPWGREFTISHPDPRSHAYRSVLAEAQLPEEFIEAWDVRGLGDRATARQKVKDYVEKNGCPDAIFCFNDEMSIAAMAALHSMGIKVPEDVIIIGCDGIEDTEYHMPALSTIQYPYAELARCAWDLLQRRIEHPETPLQSVSLKANLVLRESSNRQKLS